MANSLLITKLSDGSFSFVVNGDVVNTIINLRNDLTTVGNECHFKTSEGANLIKLQQILYHEVTIVDGAILPVASSPLDLRIKLISVGFWDWMNPAGGGGSNRFDLLLDAFSYFGNNGKIPMVDESQLKLVPFSLPDFSYLNLFPTPLVANKGLKVNSLATAYELYDIINIVTQFIRLGYTDTVPSEDIVYKALELKANISDIPVPPDDYTNNVYVNNVDPNLATIFDLNYPPTVNDNLLKSDVDNLYIGTDASTWVYNSTTLTYVTKVINSEFSNFYLTGTTSDAGGTKTAAIERSGTVGGAPGTASNHFVTRAQLDLKENLSNKTSVVVGNEASSTLYLNVLGAWTYFQQKLTDSIFGAFINALTAKTTPIDADSISIVDSADSNKAKKTTFANLKTFFKSYFDGFYALDNNVVHLSGNETRTDGTLTFKTITNANQRIFVNPLTGNIEGYNTSNSLAWRIQNTGASQGSFSLGTSSAYVYGRNGGPLELGASIPFIVPNATATTHALNKGQFDAVLLTAVSATLDFPSTATATSSDLTIAYTGAVLGDIVTLGVPFGSVIVGGCYTAFVSATDVVTVRFNNYSVASLNPASGIFKVKIIR